MALGAIECGGLIFEPEGVDYYQHETEYRFVASGTGLNVQVTASRQEDGERGTYSEDDHLTLRAAAGSPPEDSTGVALASVVLKYEDMNYPPRPEEQELYEARIMHAASAALTVYINDPKIN